MQIFSVILLLFLLLLLAAVIVPFEGKNPRKFEEPTIGINRLKFTFAFVLVVFAVLVVYDLEEYTENSAGALTFFYLAPLIAFRYRAMGYKGWILYSLSIFIPIYGIAALGRCFYRQNNYLLSGKLDSTGKKVKVIYAITVILVVTAPFILGVIFFQSD
tara:strand:+ start:390 stop:866 length:477 start_codon:yes stop_codon:yes gene_type:complete